MNGFDTRPAPRVPRAPRGDSGLILATAVSLTLGVWRIRLRLDVEDTALAGEDAT